MVLGEFTKDSAVVRFVFAWVRFFMMFLAHGIPGAVLAILAWMCGADNISVWVPVFIFYFVFGVDLYCKYKKSQGGSYV